VQGHGTALDPPGAWPKPPARHRVAANLEIRYFLRSNRAGTIFAMRQRSIIFALTLIAFSGCDPIVNIAGANFPAWLLCAIGGASLAALFRPLFVAIGIETYLWPLAIVYASFAFVLGCLLYLAFFNRV
jgi:hypothetical protein